MRFLEFVQCGLRGSLLHNVEDDDDDGAVPAVALRRTGETSALSTLARAGSGGEKPRRRSGAGIPGSSTWRPSLGAIAEDGAVLKAAAAAAAEKIVDRRNVREGAKTPARPKRAAKKRTVDRSDREDLRQFAVPAFAPTAFLF